MRIPEHHDEEQEEIATGATESGRITIRLGSGSAVGSNTVSYASRRVCVSRLIRLWVHHDCSMHMESQCISHLVRFAFCNFAV